MRTLRRQSDGKPVSYMDSLTQIVLGAACGEAVAGKNRQPGHGMGAVGGTIPDLDVLAGLFTDEITGTSFHRGFMHSFLFCTLAPWVLAWLVRRFYDEQIHQKKGYKGALMAIWLLFYLGAACGDQLHPGSTWRRAQVADTDSDPRTGRPVCLPAVARLLETGTFAREHRLQNLGFPVFLEYFHAPHSRLFHQLGTQIFQPFDDLRVQWCTVSVVDPIATLPFLAFLLLATRFNRENSKRALDRTGSVSPGSAVISFFTPYGTNGL
jgi:inner membrane protein